MAHVAITGASSGIGAALVREFVRSGASVTMVARRRDLMETLAAEVGGRTRIVAADLSHASALGWIAPAEAELGPIDVLINNAGVQIIEPTAEVDPAAARALIELDLIVPLALAGAVLPAMLARRAGTIVNISSLAALAPPPGMTHYNAAKSGLAAASESLRGELRRSGVNVLTVYPGPVDTAMSRAAYASYQPSRFASALPSGTAEELARRVRRAVEQRHGRVIYPRIYAFFRYFQAVPRLFLDPFMPPPYSKLAASHQIVDAPPRRSCGA